MTHPQPIIRNVAKVRLLVSSLALAALLGSVAPAVAGIAPPPVASTFITGVGVLPTVVLTKTVGTESNLCAGTDAITMTGGGNVTYCYEVTNTSPITVTLTDLVDNQLGSLLGNSQVLGVGATLFLTQTAPLTQTTTNTAVVHSSDGVSLTSASTDVATVTVIPVNPSIVLTKTVGTDPNVCATAGTITVTNQATVYYCYEVTNTGDITLTVHDLVDNKLGQLLTGWVHPLAPGESTFVTFPATLNQTTANTATWTAGLAGIASATAGGAATVDFEFVNVPLLSRSGLALLLLVVAGAGLVLLRRHV